MSRIFSLATIVLAALMYFFFIKPLVVSVNEKKAAIVELEGVRGQIAEFESLRDGLLARYNKIGSDDLARLDIMVPKEIDQISTIYALDELIKDHNLTLSGAVSFVSEETTATPSSPERGVEGMAASSSNSDTVNLTKAQFNVTGTYENLRALLRSLGSNLTIMDVTSLGFSAALPAEVKRNDAYRFTIGINMYSQDNG